MTTTQTESAYVTVHPGLETDHTHYLGDWLLVDCTAEGHTVGIEILGDHDPVEALFLFAAHGSVCHNNTCQP